MARHHHGIIPSRMWWLLCFIMSLIMVIQQQESHCLVDAFSSSSSCCTGNIKRWRQHQPQQQHVVCFMNSNNNNQEVRRQAEIRRTIASLKRQGRLKQKNTNAPPAKDDMSTTSQSQSQSASAQQDYASQVQAKLGKTKAKLLLGVDDENEEDYEMDEELDEYEEQQEETTDNQSKSEENMVVRKPIIDPSLLDYKDDEEMVPEPSDEELVELVAQTLQQQQQDETKPFLQDKDDNENADTQPTTSTTPTTTTGVGGTWSKNNTTKVETYQPKSGSWGAFPRPKDISQAYGGGRRVGAGFDESSLLQSQQDTRQRLQHYREKVGIDVPSEKEHAQDIDLALKRANHAMQRGMYSSAVSCLEKVTKYCSTNSKVGGKVFLELAMAYEAEGRTQEAVTVYTTLAKSRIEEIKFDAKRLLYGIEAMQFMRNEAQSEAFSRKKIRNTFIDTTGLAHIAENFDDVYETAYVDLSSNFYRRLTENVVRSNREARQILLQATGSKMVEHVKIVQALRSISRHFDSALEEERNAARPQSVAVMNGKPIVQQQQQEQQQETSSVATMIAGMDEYVLASPKQMLELLGGEWRLQLVADRQGDGVKYNNNSTLQTMDTEAMSFRSTGPAGFVKVSQSGNLEFNDEKRILSKVNVNTSGGGVLSGLMLGGGKSNPLTAPQQVVSVDSTLLVTRLAPDKKRSAADSVKSYFSVWRRVGTPVEVSESDLED